MRALIATALLGLVGASVVLAILARVAIGILGDDTRAVLTEQQIRAMAQSEALKDTLLATLNERSTTAGQASSTPGGAPTTAPVTDPNRTPNDMAAIGSVDGGKE